MSVKTVVRNTTQHSVEILSTITGLSLQ